MEQKTSPPDLEIKSEVRAGALVIETMIEAVQDVFDSLTAQSS